MKTTNPLEIIDSILSDWASPKVRRLIHALIALGLLVGSAVLAADGDWAVAALTLFGTLYAAVNKANTPAVALSDAGEIEVSDDLTYEEAGGQPFPEDPPVGQS
jgi:hypothetical protein